MSLLCEMNPHREYRGLCQACMITPTYNKKIFNKKKKKYLHGQNDMLEEPRVILIFGAPAHPLLATLINLI